MKRLLLTALTLGVIIPVAATLTDAQKDIVSKYITEIEGIKTSEAIQGFWNAFKDKLINHLDSAFSSSELSDIAEPLTTQQEEFANKNAVLKAFAQAADALAKQIKTNITANPLDWDEFKQQWDTISKKSLMNQVPANLTEAQQKIINKFIEDLDLINTKLAIKNAWTAYLLLVKRKLESAFALSELSDIAEPLTQQEDFAAENSALKPFAQAAEALAEQIKTNITTNPWDWDAFKQRWEDFEQKKTNVLQQAATLLKS